MRHVHHVDLQGRLIHSSNLDLQDTFSASDNSCCKHSCPTQHLDVRFPALAGAPAPLQRHVSVVVWTLAGNGNYRSQERSRFPLVHIPNWV